MNDTFVQFHLAQFAERCIHAGSFVKSSCHSTFRAVFKDRWKRPRIFVRTNLFLCLLTLVYFSCTLSSLKVPLGIRRRTKYSSHWAFVINELLDLILAFGLLYAHKKEDSKKCQFWCFAETLVILLYFFLTLAEVVSIHWPGLVFLGVVGIIKLYGIWVIYYHSLELKSSSYSRHSSKVHEEDGMKITYFAPAPAKNPKAITRKETDLTSIGSSSGSGPRSPGFAHLNCQSGQTSRFFNDNAIMTSTKAFTTNAEPPQYSEIVMDEHAHDESTELPLGATFYNQDFAPNNLPAPTPPSRSPPPFPKDNIIRSNLMCGGSSSINFLDQ